MDEYLAPGTGSRAAFVPDRRFTLGAAAGALIALGVAVFAEDKPGRLLAAVVFLILLAYVVSDLVFSPRLVVTTEGLVIRSPLTRATLGWADIEHVRADTRDRLGLRSTTLEIDAGSTLAVFSRRSLGTDPEQAAELIDSFRPL
ncbi:MAG: PH domain-containing protein [Jatrophihabitans sp.]